MAIDECPCLLAASNPLALGASTSIDTSFDLPPPVIVSAGVFASPMIFGRELEAEYFHVAQSRPPITDTPPGSATEPARAWLPQT